MCLDSVLDHSMTEVPFAVIEAIGYEGTLKHFLENASNAVTSPFHGKDTVMLFDKLLRDAGKKPVPALSCERTCRSPVTGEDSRLNVQATLGSADNYIDLSKWMSEALAGDASGLSSDLYLSETDPRYDEVAIFCSDWYTNSTWPQRQNLNTLLRSISPRVQGLTSTYYLDAVCRGWQAPLAVANPPKQIEVPVTEPGAPILLVSALYDPVTNHEMAVKLQRQLKGSVLLTRDGDGHGSYDLEGETRNAIDAYLIDLKVPKDGTVYDA